MGKYELPEPPSILRDRARASAEELQRLSVMIPSAALGVFFLALTQQVEPPLTDWEQRWLLIAIAGMALAAASAIATWIIDAQWNRHLATYKEAAPGSAEKASAATSAEAWLAWEKRTLILFAISFVPAVLATFAYIWLRAK